MSKGKPTLSDDGQPVRVALYTRISTDEAHQPYSLGAQSDRLDSFVKSQENWRVLRKYEDQMTGTVLERPGLQAALTDARKGLFDLLLVFRVDRLARSVRSLALILEDLDEYRVAFRSATEPFDTTSSAGRMMIQMLGEFAEFERATLIERVVAGMTRKAAEGGWVGGPRPFGYDRDPDSGGLRVNEDERELVEKIFRLYVGDRLGSSAIARRLNENGSRTKQGALWRAKTVRIILTNPVYLGEVSWQGTIYPGRHSAIIEQATFEKAQEILRQRGEDASRRRQNISEYPLSGLLRCMNCGSGFVGSGAHGNGGAYRYYACRKRQQYGTSVCDQASLSADRLEAEVFSHLITMLSDGQILACALEKFVESWLNDGPRHDRDLEKVDRNIKRAKAQIDRYLRAFEAGTLPTEACGSRLRELSDELAHLELRKQELLEGMGEKFDPPCLEEISEGARKVAGLLKDYQEMSTPKLKALLRQVMPEVEITNRRHIVPVIRLPMVLIMGSTVGPRGLEPRPPD